MPSWLKTHKKQELVDLAKEAGLKTEEAWRKEDLVDKLDSYLQENITRLATNASFEPYYGSSRRTPGKVRASSSAKSDDPTEVRSVVKGRGRLATAVKSESDDPTSPTQAISTAIKKTPIRPRKAELPVSPADVANQVERQAKKVAAGFDDAFSATGFQQAVNHLRAQCSSVTGIQLTCLILEASGLQSTIMPWRYVGDIPMLPFPGLPSSYAVKLPDFFILLTGFFWKTTILWAFTSMIIPAFFAYFYNLTIKDVKRGGERVQTVRHPVDPMTFNVVKALVTFMVYGQGVTFGLVEPIVAHRVSHSMYGGYSGVIIGSGICVLASLYEAVQRK